MSTNDTSPMWQQDPAKEPGGPAGQEPEAGADAAQAAAPSGARVGTVVWGLIVLALATLIIISKLGLVALNGTYVLIGLMIGAGAALVVGGLFSMRNKQGAGPRR